MESNDTRHSKVLYCIRHGESSFNEWRRRSLLNLSWIWVKDPMIIDAPLTQKGEQQAIALNEKIKSQQLDSKVEIVICSPLTRAIQTAMAAFKDCNVPFTVEPLCREELGTACDIGSSPDELAKRFAQSHCTLDFSSLSLTWWAPTSKVEMIQETLNNPRTPNDVIELRESKQELDDRIQLFLQKLNALPQQHIAIVGHSGYFKRMLRMNRKLANCQLYIVHLDQVIAT